MLRDRSNSMHCQQGCTGPYPGCRCHHVNCMLLVPTVIISWCYVVCACSSRSFSASRSDTHGELCSCGGCCCSSRRSRAATHPSCSASQRNGPKVPCWFSRAISPAGSFGRYASNTTGTSMATGSNGGSGSITLALHQCWVGAGHPCHGASNAAAHGQHAITDPAAAATDAFYTRLYGGSRSTRWCSKPGTYGPCNAVWPGSRIVWAVFTGAGGPLRWCTGLGVHAGCHAPHQPHIHIALPARERDIWHTGTRSSWWHVSCSTYGVHALAQSGKRGGGR